MSNDVPSWTAVPADRILVPSLLAFAATSLLFDRAAGLDLVAPDSPDPFGRMLWAYGTRFDPLVAENPLFLRIMSFISGFVYGPAYLWLARALVRRDPAIVVPTRIYAHTILYSMVVHVAAEVLWPRPPDSWAVLAAIYAPYVLVPLALLWRVETAPWCRRGARATPSPEGRRAPGR
ncbi:MAG: DUF2781 domain-containing protein [Deltaproteobacteria bacterium]|nr:MAG: DUF2781 domain-containing protein [Deltaproteobacteria bacterium]